MSTTPNFAQPMSQEFSQSAPASFTLYNAPAVTLATFFGTPAAGSVLMAVNFNRLGEKGKAALVLVLGFAVTGLAIAIGFATPKGVDFPLGLLLLIGMRFLASKWQGEAIAQHVSRGGRLGSRWAATGLGVAFLAVLLVGISIPVLAAGGQGRPAGSGFGVLDSLSALVGGRNKVAIGQNDEVYYTGTATKEDAEKLGAALKTEGYLKDRGVSVFLDKGANGTTISLVVQQSAIDEPGILLEEEEVVRGVADSVGGFPIHVKVIDKYETVKKQGIVGRVSPNGQDEIYYYSNATEADATALFAALQKQEYFSGRGTTVMFAKDEGGKSMSFVVKQGFWDDPEHVAGFQALVKAVAPSVGGLPVTLKLVTSELEDKKDVVVQ